MAYLEIKNFNKTFKDGFKVLNDINLNVEKGEVVSVIGSSGSGKTTLLRCINFLETPDEGVMALDGTELFNGSTEKKDSDSVLRNKRLNFGLVFQSFNLFPQYNVLKNVTLAPTLLLKTKIKNYKKQLKLQKKSRAEIKKLLNEYKETEKNSIHEDGLSLLNKIGLSDKINSYPCQLSGGQQQRVAIARALALKPKILCFDEPTSALDPELTGEVLNVIKTLKEENRTMIIVTHEMGFAKNVSDKVIFMSEGNILESGTPTDIFDNPKSEKLIKFLSNVSNKDDLNEKKT